MQRVNGTFLDVFLGMIFEVNTFLYPKSISHEIQITGMQGPSVKKVCNVSHKINFLSYLRYSCPIKMFPVKRLAFENHGHG